MSWLNKRNQSVWNGKATAHIRTPGDSNNETKQQCDFIRYFLNKAQYVVYCGCGINSCFFISVIYMHRRICVLSCTFWWQHTEQHGTYFADDIFDCIHRNEYVCNSVKFPSLLMKLIKKRNWFRKWVGHYCPRWWPRFLTSYVINRPQWVNWDMYLHSFPVYVFL